MKVMGPGCAAIAEGVTAQMMEQWLKVLWRVGAELRWRVPLGKGLPCSGTLSPNPEGLESGAK